VTSFVTSVTLRNPSLGSARNRRKELWYRETAIAAYLDVKRKAEEAAAKKAEEVAKATTKATEEENKHVMDVNSEVDSESEEETEEVKVKRRKAKGKAVDTKYKRNTVPVDYVGCPGVPICKMCECCKVPVNAKYQRPCVANVQMDANDQIFYVRLKDCCFVCLMQNNVCSFTREDEADFIMPEAVNDEELQAKLRKLCDKQDTFQKQKDKEKAERNKMLRNSTKAGTSRKVEVNMKALGSTLKVVAEEDDIIVEAHPKRARMVTNSAGGNERILLVTESLHGINKALIETVIILRDTRAVSKRQAKTLHRIKTCMANLQSAMQMYVGQVHYHSKELENLMVEGLEDKEEEVEEVHEEVEGPHEEGREGREVEDNETMKDPEADKL
ncbi:hypothetical protein M422DRAFT_252429, partial [Sphaerobolus stellatus SS14]